MPSETENNCTVYIYHENANPPSQQELSAKLASKDDDDKIEALEDIIVHMVNGEPYKMLLMQVLISDLFVVDLFDSYMYF